LIEEKYLINEKLFINFTRRFEEAKYSGHDLSREISESALSDYNQILKAILAQDTRFRIALKYFKALLRKKPLFIEYAKGKA